MRYLLNYTKKTIAVFFALFSLLLSFSVTANNNLLGKLSETREMQLIVLKGEKLPTLLGKNAKNYSVMVVSGKKLQPIPYQFDDWNVRGFPYVPGGTIKVEGQEDIIEVKDELAFMLRDTGAQADATLKSAVAGKVVLELAFKENNVERYAYIVEGNAERSEKFYTHFDKKTGLIKTSTFSLQTEPGNLLSWSDMYYQGYHEGKKSILDTMKLRVKAKLGFIKATINNNLIPNEVSAVKNGPVRTLIALDASISILGVGLADAGASVTVTDQTLQFPVYLTIPKAASILSDLNLEVSLDFNDMDGVPVRTELGPKEPVYAGDKTKGANPEDLKINLEHSWLSGSSGQNWDIIAFFSGKEGFKPTLDVIYKDSRFDSKADTPERFSGSHPHVGYKVTDIVYGQEIVIGIDLYFDDAFWSKDGLENAVESIRNPMPVTVIAQ
jgi:hypothetical protein